MLDDLEIERYSRQIMVNEIGGPGQQKLKGASVLVVGAGGLGSPVLLYLKAAGVGSLTIADGDTVERTNLNRQVLFDELDLGVNKAERGAEKLEWMAGKTDGLLVVPYRITTENVGPLVQGKTLVVDCTDNYETRVVLNRACMAAKVPLLSTAVAAWTGQIALYVGQPCYECWVDPPRQPDPCGVLGAMAGIVGTMAAVEAVKFIVGAETPSLGHLLIVNGLTLDLQSIELPSSPACPVCSSSQQT